MKERTYIAIDLKSFYASVECRERGLDPLDTNLVVADESRTDKTICLAVTPSLKSYGISGRGRLFEVKQRVKEANAGRQHDAPGHKLDGSSCFHSELLKNPNLAIDFVIAPPRMAYYMEYSTRIYNVYLKYVAPEDIVVYSIDEVFMDVTDYLNTYKLSPHDLAMKIILDVLETTGITATAGIGTNLFLCKVAMDIVAKHIPADANGVRIAELDEMSYRKTLWAHQPLTDFWRVGRGIAKKLEENGMFTMGDVARCSVHNEDKLYLKSALSRDAKGSALIKDLESKDFGEIFTLLFSDAQFVQGTKALVNNKTWQFTKDEILAAIEAISENTVWDNLIGKDAVPLLRSDFAKVKSFRNDIMHAHSMETAKYNEAAKLIKEINKQLYAEIGNIIGTKETVQGDSAQDFNAALGDAIRNMDEAQSIKNWQEQLIALQSSIPTIKSENLTAALTAYTKIIDSPGFKAAQQLVSSPQWDSIQRSLKGISKIQTDISPALIELQKVASSIHQAVPPELLALQQSLQAFKPDPALLELLQKLNRWQDRLSDGQDKT